MVVALNRIFFRPDQATNVGKKFVEWMKDHPPDKTLYKNLCILIKSTEGGDLEALGIDDVMKGKVEELLKLYSAMNLFLASGVDGLKYRTEICLNFSEAYKIINLAPPQV